MNITQYGRIEVDLGRIPAPASMDLGRDDGFQRVLEGAGRDTGRPAGSRQPATREDPQDDVPAAGTDVRPQPEAAPDATQAAPIPAGAPAQPPAQQAVVADRAAPAPLAGRELTAPDATADAARPGFAPLAPNGGDDLAPATAVHPDPALAAVPVSPTQAPAQQIPADLRLPGTAGRDGRLAPLSAPAVTAAYRTLTPQALQLTEAARDSVFKQILLRLGRESSEMRVRLEPPDLGELDLRLTVDKGGQLRLFLGVERPELAAMLDRNLDQLKQHLQQNGLQVVHAEVRGGGGGDREDRSHRHHFGDADHSPALDAPPATTTGRGGWIGTDGLDFWV